jgi:general secretion pathway protein F
LARKFVPRKDSTRRLAAIMPPTEGVAPEQPLYYLWRVSPSRMGFFFDQLAQLLHAGVNIYEALLELCQRGVDRRLSHAAASMVGPIANGASFADQLERYPELFPAHVRGLVRAGEKSGRLDRIAAQIAEDYQERQKRAWVISLAQLWFTMPLVLILFVVPLPRAIDLGWSWYFGFILRIAVPVLIGTIILYQLSKVILNLRRVRRFRDRLLYALPMAGLLTRRAATRRYVLALEALIGSGVEIQEAMEIAASTAGNLVIEAQLQEAAQKVRDGTPIGPALAGAKALPVELRQSLETAERAGSYDDVLDGLRHWARELQARSLKLAGIGGYGIVLVLVSIVVAFAVAHTYKSYIESVFRKADEWMP